MTRLFTFGCSFTQYWWPTWADILGYQHDFYENWGRCGAGNQFVFNALIECDLRNTLTKDDLVCIMFTNVCREDRYVQKNWLTAGNIFSQKIYDAKFLRRFADIRGYYIRDLATIYAIDKLLTQIGCKKFYFSMIDITHPNQFEASDWSDELKDLSEFYQPTIDKIRPSVHKVVFNNDWDSRPNYNFRTTVSATWKINYIRIKDPSWPMCESQEDFLKLPQHIQKECRDIFNFDENCWINESKTNRFPIRKIPAKRTDTHPVPIEHLEYLEKICPELPILNSTKSWLSEIHHLGSTNQDYTHLLSEKILKSTVARW